MKPKMGKNSTFMDNPPFESSGFYEAENCAILPKKNFSTKCMNPIIPGRPKIFIISTLNEAKKLSTTLLPPEPEGDPETEMPVIQNREQVQQIVRSQSTVSSRDIAVQVRSNSSRDRARSGERSSMKSAKSKGDIRSSRKLKDVSEIVLTNAILQRQPNIDTQPFLREPTPPALQVCAKHSYNGKSSKQMSFLSGDLIKVVINESKSGWKYGENCRSRERGWFPETYLSGFG